MKRRDEDKTSLVEFLRSIKFAQQKTASADEHLECPTHFANFRPSARGASEANLEDSQLIRSAN